MPIITYIEALFGILMVLLTVINSHRRTGKYLTPIAMTAILSFGLSGFAQVPWLPQSLNAIGQNGNFVILNNFQLTLLMYLVALCFMNLGYIMTKPSRITRVFPIQRWASDDFVGGTLAVGILSLIFMIFIFLTFYLTHDIPALSPEPSYARTFGADFGEFTKIRPFYVAGLAGLELLMVTSLLRLVTHPKRWSMSIVVLIPSAITVYLTDNRAFLVWPLALLVLALGRSRIISEKKVVVIGLVVAVFVIVLGALRGGGGVDLNSIFMGTFTGNTFSDLRDFTFLYTMWDANGVGYYFGKTILSGVLGLVPSSLLHFRQLYDWGIVSNTIAGVTGLAQAYSFGFRPGIFGEWFFNFGWTGVIVTQFLLGVLWGKLDGWDNSLEGSIDTWIVWFFANSMMISSGIPATYIQIFTLFILPRLTIFLRVAAGKRYYREEDYEIGNRSSKSLV